MAAQATAPANLKRLTLLLLRSEGSVLLGRKKRGFGAGKVNGFGGKVERGESMMEAAVREMREESGLTVEDASLRGILSFNMLGDGNHLEIHVFHASKYHGTITESDEMDPFWVKDTEIPLGSMWLDDAYWFPHFLAGDCFRGVFKFQSHSELLEHDVKVVTPAVLEEILPSSWRRPA
eukprot:m.205427 g.205427  ORF g.205427 m.205427 type:complete len:178 (+) comp22927_c0_seq1:305-838(+)